MIEFYKEFGELGYLANYSNHSFIKDGVLYKTVEHYYQSKKFDAPDIIKKILDADTPKEASNIGRDRTNIRIPKFKDIKVQVMYEGILEKFRQNRSIAYKLIETRNRDIAEATVNEYYWGIGKDKSGENVIGDILVKVREKIKKEILANIINNSQGKEIYVLGHNNPDADSIISSYLLSKILCWLGANAHFAVLSENYEYSKNDKKLIEAYLHEKPIVVDDTNDKLFMLVDHNSLDILFSSQVIGAIDHHVITGDVYDTLEIEYASTALLIYDLFKDLYDFSKYDKELVCLSVLADTDYLNSPRFTLEDKKIYDGLGIDLDVSELQKEYFYTCDFTLSIEENLLNNYKEYNNEYGRVRRSLIYSYTDGYLENFYKYIEYLKNSVDTWLLIWCDFESKTTYVWFMGETYQMDTFVTSTNLVFKFLEDKKKLL